MVISEANHSSRHMNLNDYAATIEKAALTVCAEIFVSCSWLNCFSQTIAEGKAITGDLGGKSSTKEYTDAIITKLGKA